MAQVNNFDLVIDPISRLCGDDKTFLNVHVLELCKAEDFQIFQILRVEDFLKRALIDSAFAQIEILDR